MCHSIHQIFTCGHHTPQLSLCPLEFLKGHTLAYATHKFAHACWCCRREQKLRQRLEEHKRRIEEQQRAGEADDESEVEGEAFRCHREGKVRERCEEHRRKFEERERVAEADDEREEVEATKQSC